MTSLSEELTRLRNQDADVAYILDAFAAIESVHSAALHAMGQRREIRRSVKSSAGVSLSVGPALSTAGRSLSKEKE